MEHTIHQVAATYDENHCSIPNARHALQTMQRLVWIPWGWQTVLLSMWLQPVAALLLYQASNHHCRWVMEAKSSIQVSWNRNAVNLK